MQKSTIKFWRGILLPEGMELAAYQEVLQQLSRGELTGGLHVERLRVAGDYPLYSARSGIKDRIIFTIVDGYLVVLDLVTDHDYDKCSFLNAKILRNYLAMQGVALAASIENLEAEKVTELEGIAPPNPDAPSGIDLVGFEYMGGKTISLSDAQGGVVNTCKIPALIIGPAGSGKTSMALWMLKDYSLKHPGCCIMYVTKSKHLVDKMRLEWENMGGSTDVIFGTCEEFFKKRGYLPPGTPVRTQSDFFIWYESHTKRQPAPKGADGSLSLQCLWEELVYAAACNNLDEYKAIGRKKSRFNDNHEMQKYIFNLRNHYLAFLQETGAVDLDLITLTPPKRAEDGEASELAPIMLLTVDEVQDCGTSLLQGLCQASGFRLAAFYGVDQLLAGNTHDTSTLTTVFFNAKQKKPTEYPLPALTHRCPKRVAELVTALKEQKRKATGGATLKWEAAALLTPDDAIDGEVQWMEAKDVAIAECIKQFENTASVVVLTTDALLQEAREKFGDKFLILTVAQAKGLEFNVALLYKIMQGSEYQAINKVLKDSKTDASEKTNRPTDFTHIHLRQPFDVLVTAVSRSQEKVIVIEENLQAPLLRALQETATPTAVAAKAPQPSAKSSKREWRALIAQLLREGGEAANQAFHLWKTHLPDEDFGTFETQVLGPVPHKKVQKIPAHTRDPQPASSAEPPRDDKNAIAITLQNACLADDTDGLLSTLRHFTPPMNFSKVLKQNVGNPGIPITFQEWLSENKQRLQFFISAVLNASDIFLFKHLFVAASDEVFSSGHTSLEDWKKVRQIINQIKQNKNQSLLWILSKENSRLLLKLAVSGIFNPGFKDSDQLSMQIRHNNIDTNIIHALLIMGANPNGQNEAHCPLIEAMLKANRDIVKILLDCGADPRKIYKMKPQTIVESLTGGQKRKYEIWLKKQFPEKEIKAMGPVLQMPLVLAEVLDDKNMQALLLDESKKSIFENHFKSQLIPLSCEKYQLVDYFRSFIDALKELLYSPDQKLQTYAINDPTTYHMKINVDGQQQTILEIVRNNEDLLHYIIKSILRCSRLSKDTSLLKYLEHPLTNILAKLFTALDNHLINKFSTVQQIDSYNVEFNPLQQGLMAQNIDIMKMLISLGANLNWPIENHNSSLMLNIFNKNLDIINLLLKQDKIDVHYSRLTDKITALHLAIQMQALPIVNRLLEKNADPDAKCDAPFSFDTEKKEVFSLGLSKHHKQTHVMKDATPLIIAAKIGNLDIVQALLKAGANAEQCLITIWMDHSHKKLNSTILETLKTAANKTNPSTIDEIPSPPQDTPRAELMGRHRLFAAKQEQQQKTNTTKHGPDIP